MFLMGKSQILRTEKMIEDPSISAFKDVFIAYFLYDFCLAQQLKINRKYTALKQWLETKLRQVRT